MSTVIICEKPSQAKNIRMAIGDKMGEIVPMSGHILSLKEPEDVNDNWKRWNTDLLWPGEFYGLKVSPDKKSIFAKVKDAVSRADRVIIATDSDREGQLLADEVLTYLKFRGQVFRAIFNKEDAKTLREAFDNLKPNSEYKNLYHAGMARQQADQVSNLTLTRTATVRFAASGAKRAIGIGRVKTPVMSLICAREDERINFKPQTYFEIKAVTKAASGSLDLTCRGLPKSLMKQMEEETAEEEQDGAEENDAALAELEPLAGKIMTKELADSLRKSVEGSDEKVQMTSKKQSQIPPKLFDLTTLQAAASSKFGFSGTRTLEIAQSLYETYKVTTYPRSEAQHLPEVEMENAKPLADVLTNSSEYAEYKSLVKEPILRKKTHFSDRALEGMSHYAIIPNFSVADEMVRIIDSLPADEMKIFDLIARRYLASLAPDYEYQKTDIWFMHQHPGPDGGDKHEWKFSTSGSMPLSQGWRLIAGNAGDGNELPSVKNGEQVKVTKADLMTKQTSPRPRFNDGTILLAMKSPWHFVDPEKKELKAMLKESEGIGRPSTRDSVVEGLVKQGLIQRQKKELSPTPAGMSLWKLLRRASPGLTDVVRTAIWETLFKKVLLGQMTMEAAVKRIIDETEKAKQELIEASKGMAEKIGKAAPPSPKAVMFAQKLAEMKGLDFDVKRKGDRDYVYGFLEEHAPKEGETLPPSEKQVSFAKSIAERTGQEIPKAALTDGKAMKEWLDAAVQAAPPQPPSEKALGFAESIAEQKGIELPADVRTSSKACSEFINKHKSGGSSKGRSSASGPKKSAPRKKR